MRFIMTILICFFLLRISVTIQTDLHQPVREWTAASNGLCIQRRLFIKGNIKGTSETEIEGEMSVESSRDISIM